MFELSKSQKLLAVPESFIATAMAFPEKVDQALALLDNVHDIADLLNKTNAMEHYAKRIKVDVQTSNFITYGRLKIEAKLGELLAVTSTPAERGAKGGRGNKAGTSHAPAFGRTETKVYRRVAKTSPKIDEYFQEAQSDQKPVEMSTAGFLRFATGTEKAGASAHVSQNTGIPEWYTPEEYIEAARAALGTIDLDPASSKIAQKTVKAKRYYSIDDDGLSKEWAGAVFLNPPYTSDLVTKFVNKLCEHVESGDVTAAVLLVNNATETAWFQYAATVAAAICFPASRIKFLDDTGKPGAPLQGQAILYFGRAVKRFRDNFADFGFCVEVCDAT